MTDDEERRDDVSSGLAADRPEATAAAFAPDVTARFEIFSYRNAATILRHGFPSQHADIEASLRALTITREMIRMPGGSKGPIAHHGDTLFPPTWQEARIAADLGRVDERLPLGAGP